MSSEKYPLTGTESAFNQFYEGWDYEPPLVAGDKATLRKAEPEIGGAWHQDGKFMGEVKALNLWLSLSECGEQAPGLDLVPFVSEPQRAGIVCG